MKRLRKKKYAIVLGTVEITLNTEIINLTSKLILEY
jgi:hypothetical protein